MNSLLRAIWKSSKFLLALTALAQAVPNAQAEGELSWLGASGSLRPSLWTKDTSFSSSSDYFTGSAWLTLRPQEWQGFKGYFDGYVISEDINATNHSSYTQVEAREAYIEKSVSSFDFKIGRQITVWGRADKLNPTDQLTVRDFTLLMTDDEDQRKGVLAAQVVYNWDLVRITGIWQPEWRFPTYPLAPQAGINLQNVEPQKPGSNFGLKIDSTGGAIDGSLSYYNGRSKTPDLSLISAGQTIQVGLNYNHIQVWGFDFAKNFGSYGVRGEAAYTRTDNPDGLNPLIQNSNIFAVLGADRTIIEDFNINAQVLYRKIFNYQDINTLPSAALQVLASQEQTVTNQKYPEQFGMSLRPDYKAFNETLELEMAFVMWFRNGDYLFRPKLTYAFSDRIKGVFGGEIFRGPGNTFFGELEPISSGYAELRVLF